MRKMEVKVENAVTTSVLGMCCDEKRDRDIAPKIRPI